MIKAERRNSRFAKGTGSEGVISLSTVTLSKAESPNQELKTN